MKKVWILLLVCLILAGCGNNNDEPLTVQQVQQIVLDDLGVSEKDASAHVHIGEHEGTPCYSVYVTVDGRNLEYRIHSTTGQILYVGESSHTH